MTRRLNLWCGPRNVSTALMYSFRQRADTRVVDEPLYGHYLASTGAAHPGADEILATMDTDIDRVLATVVLGPCDRPLLVLKQMAHHLVPSVPLDFLDQCAHLFLVRDPVEVLTTIVRQLPDPSLRDIGVARQLELHAELIRRGHDPAVVDSRDLLRDPQGVLTQLCAVLGISWQPEMLTWPPGPKPEDGVWAKHWYANAHASGGFEPYRPKEEPLPNRLRPLADEATEIYTELTRHSLKGRA